MLNRRFWIALTVLLIAPLLTSPLVADDCTWFSQDSCSPSQEREIDLLQTRGAPEVLKGPVILQLKNVNRLRYHIQIGRKLTIEDGPDVKLTKFVIAVPKVAPAAAPTMQMDNVAKGDGEAEALVEQATTYEGVMEEGLKKSEIQAQREKLSKGIQALAAALAGKPNTQDVRGSVAFTEGVGVQLSVPAPSRVDVALIFLQGELATLSNEIEDKITEADEEAEKVKAARSMAQALAKESGTLLATVGGEELGNRVDALKKGDLNTALEAQWPTELDTLRERMDALLRELEEIPLRMKGFSEWAESGNNRDDYRDAVKSAQNLSKGLAAIEPGSANHKAFVGLQEGLRSWDTILSGLTSKTGFEEKVTVLCGHPHFKKRTTEIQIVRVDRLEDDPKKNTSKEVLAEIDCPSSLSVSGGMGVTGIDERDIEIIQGRAKDDSGDDNGLVPVIGFKNRSSEQVNPTFLLNTRLTDCPKYNFHLSGGTVFDFDNPDNGLAIGYLLGASVSFKDGFFLTGGVQAQRVETLTGGFEFGEPVPGDLTEAPTEKEWKFDWVLAVTYRIP